MSGKTPTAYVKMECGGWSGSQCTGVVTNLTTGTEWSTRLLSITDSETTRTNGPPLNSRDGDILQASFINISPYYPDHVYDQHLMVQQSNNPANTTDFTYEGANKFDPSSDDESGVKHKKPHKKHHEREKHHEHEEQGGRKKEEKKEGAEETEKPGY